MPLLKLTYHVVFDGRPVIFTYHAVTDVKLDSVNVTVNVTF